MTKRLLSLLLILLTVLSVTALAAEPSSVYVNDTRVENAVRQVQGYTTYVSLDDVVKALYPDASATLKSGTTTVTAGGVTVTAKVGQQYMVANGRYLYIPGKVLAAEDGSALVPSETLAKAYGLTVAADTAHVRFSGRPAPLESGDSYYNAKDLDLISRVVQHEAGNQSLAGKMGVANCILNRVKRGAKAGFANTVSEVVFQKNQFPGATNAVPKAEAIVAAKLAMEGATTVDNACWFNRAGLRTTWAAKNKTRVVTIGNHDFYA